MSTGDAAGEPSVPGVPGMSGMSGMSGKYGVPIVPLDPRWSSTFPHVVAPREGEWLPGLLLRCDLANGWPGGQTASSVMVSASSASGRASLGRYVYATMFDIPLLAQSLAVPYDAIERTTFRRALARLYPESQLPVSGLSPTPPHHVCPRCVAERHHLDRELALPFLEICADHQFLLQHSCVCGASLVLLSADGPPFACPACGRLWADLPELCVTDDALHRDGQMRALYRAILAEDAHFTAAQLRDAIRIVAHARGRHVSRRAVGTPWGMVTPLLTAPVRVASLMANLVMLQVSVPAALDAVAQPRQVRSDKARDLAAAAAEGQATSPPPCPNRACPKSQQPTGPHIHFTQRLRGERLYYCDECGARFTADRLCTVYDEGHGAARFSPTRLAAAQARVRAWRDALTAVCEDLLARGEPISMKRAFPLAGIPHEPQLRAQRLGLRAVVERAASEQLRRMSEQQAAAGGVRQRVGPMRIGMYRRCPRQLRRDS